MAAAGGDEDLSKQFVALGQRLTSIEFKLALPNLRKQAEALEVSGRSPDSSQEAATRALIRRMEAIIRELGDVSRGNRLPRGRR